MVCEALELPNFELSEIFSLYFSPETAFVCCLVYVGNTFCETNTSHLTSSSHQHWRLKHVHVSLLTPPPPHQVLSLSSVTAVGKSSHGPTP